MRVRRHKWCINIGYVTYPYMVCEVCGIVRREGKKVDPCAGRRRSSDWDANGAPVEADDAG